MPGIGIGDSPQGRGQSPIPIPGTALVFGASGYIGSHLVPALAARGWRVRACARHAGVLEAKPWPPVEIVAADALKPETLPAALAGIDVAYYLVHSMAAGRDFGRLDLEAADHFGRAAATAGVKRIVYLGGLVPEGARSEHLLSRRDTGEALRRHPVPVTEIRAGIIVGPGSAAFEVMRDLVLHLPVMVTPRWVRAKSPPIALPDLLHYLVEAPRVPAMAGGIYDAAGPETLTYEAMMRAISRLMGRREPLILPVPVLTPELSALWLNLVTAVPAPIARALIGGLKHDFTADDAALRALLPHQLLGFEDAVRAALEAERRHAVAARWTEGAFAFREYRADYAYYAKRAGGEIRTRASAAALWQVVSAIGGENRYYAFNALWSLRETIDWLLGGNGRNHGRRDPQEVRVGDVIDSWRVVGVEPRRRLTLVFGMKAPGAGVLEFEIEEASPAVRRLAVTAYWHPAGVWGLAYWWAMFPAHLFLFGALVKAIARRAEAMEAG
ncbi:MAG: DUF2867 domain-containing protein [Burkholderiales bacterium]|nr:DUF2867 domain-containing protein [Burkholderiales bacterium]